MTPMNLSTACKTLQQAKRVAVLTGAGVSAQSGIPTFRDALTGHWARFRPEDLASPEAYLQNPEQVWEWYAGRYSDVCAAQPNPGHELLTQLEKQVADFFLATQNVDGLHSRSGSQNVVELHGNLNTARCENTHCHHITQLPPPQHFIPPPTCPHCHQRMRPNIVWFGEYLPEQALNAAQKAFAQADVALIIGTSSVVYPAAGLAFETLEQGGKVIEINPDQTEVSELVSFSLRQTASIGLAQLMNFKP